ncbi:MAG: hypothetical protein R3B93_25635 [Bacteroidia bacterium]
MEIQAYWLIPLIHIWLMGLTGKIIWCGDCGTDSANQFITVTGATVPTADFCCRQWKSDL